MIEKDPVSTSGMNQGLKPLQPQTQRVKQIGIMSPEDQQRRASELEDMRDRLYIPPDVMYQMEWMWDKLWKFGNKTWNAKDFTNWVERCVAATEDRDVKRDMRETTRWIQKWADEWSDWPKDPVVLPEDNKQSEMRWGIVGDESRDSGIQNKEEETEINGMFKGFAEAEESLNDEAQKALGGIGRGNAAELMGKVIDKGDGIRNPSRYVITAANRSSGMFVFGSQDQPKAEFGESAEQGMQPGYGIPLPEDDDDDYYDQTYNATDEAKYEEYHQEERYEEGGCEGYHQEDEHEEGGYDQGQDAEDEGADGQEWQEDGGNEGGDGHCEDGGGNDGGGEEAEDGNDNGGGEEAGDGDDGGGEEEWDEDGGWDEASRGDDDWGDEAEWD